MMQAVVIEGIDQGTQDVFLSHQFGEIARAPFAGQYLITHVKSFL